MKRLLALVLALMCMLSFTGCIDFRQRYFTEENGEHYLLLPISKEKVNAGKYYDYLRNFLDIDLLKSAEEKISQQASKYSERGSFYLSTDEENYLCLCMEIVVKLEPPSGGEWLEGGCGIDHEHVFFRERITK
ncbi:MAG: hypothetical protein IJX13_06155 [Clostridia bacterium]|nr:hypothetical protein [Clostridia bacterium]